MSEIFYKNAEPMSTKSFRLCSILTLFFFNLCANNNKGGLLYFSKFSILTKKILLISVEMFDGPVHKIVD